jgi:hypothetical protein
MATNVFFSPKVSSEQTLFEDIVIESIKMYGQDVYYIPRDIVARDRILNEDIESKFSAAYTVEMYIENTEGFEGEQNIFQKFGMEIRDEATFIVARRSWQRFVGNWNNGVQSIRPAEGDLIYLPMSNSMFEISFVEHEQPFYQLNNLPIFKLQCALYEHNDEDFETGVEQVDAFNKLATATALKISNLVGTIQEGKRYHQDLGDGVSISAKVVDIKYTGSNPTYIYVVDVETSDGGYHEFVQSDPGNVDTHLMIDPEDSGNNTIAIDSVVTVTSNDNDQVLPTDGGAQNDDFEDVADPLIDFSESNPFGEPN